MKKNKTPFGDTALGEGLGAFLILLGFGLLILFVFSPIILIEIFSK